MPTRKRRIQHAEVVQLFAGRLREVRRSRGMTQADLARKANVTTSHIWKLESGGAAPGVDLADRLAKALGTTLSDLLPASQPPNDVPMLQLQARQLLESLLQSTDRETLLMLVPLLARLNESPTRKRG